MLSLGRDIFFVKFSLCSGGDKAGDGSGTSRKSEEEEGSKLGVLESKMDVWLALLRFILFLRAQVRAREGKRQQGRDLEGQRRPNLSQVETTLGPVGSRQAHVSLLRTFLRQS